MLRTHLLAPILLLATATPVIVAAYLLAGRLVRARLGHLALAWFLAVMQVTATLQILGAVGAWSPVPLVVAAWLGSAAVWGLTRIVPEPAVDAGAEPEAGRDTPDDDLATWIRWLLVAVPVAIGIAALAAALSQPDTANDSMLYHRPMLGAWLRSGTFWRIPSLENGASYEGGYWSNGDLFSLWAAILYGRDWLVQLTSLVWLPGAWLACAAAARTLGLARWSAALVASGIVSCFGIVGGQLSMMHVDLYTTLCLAVMVWATVRWWRHDGAGRPVTWLFLAGLAAGAAVGSKQFALPFCAAWIVVVAAFVLRQRNWWGLVALLGGTLALSIAWPIRAAVVTGSPLWPVGAGPFPAPKVVLEFGARSVVGLARDAGPGQVLVALVLGLVTGYSLFPLQLLLAWRRVWTWTSAQRLRILGLGIPVFGYLTYLISPGTGQFPGQILITSRVFASAALTTILVLGAATLRSHETGADAADPDAADPNAADPNASDPDTTTRPVRRARVWFAASIILGFIVTYAFHSVSTFGWSWWARLLGIATGLAVGWLVTGGRLSGPTGRRIVTGAAAGLAACSVAIAAPAKAANWYPYQGNLAYYRPVLDWLRTNDIHDSRIAYAGVYSAPLLGRSFSNTVYWLGEPTAHDGMRVWTDQAAWERALVASCTDYVVLGTDAAKTASTSLDQPMYAGWGRPLPEWDWAPTSPVLQRVAGGPPAEVAVYRVTAPKPASCVDPGPAARNDDPAP